MADKLLDVQSQFVEIDFAKLVSSIQVASDNLSKAASHAVNSAITLRNWIIGHYILEYEQQGTDRAQYGARLIDQLSERLTQLKIPRVDSRDLRRCRQFAQVYPQIRETLSPEFHKLLLASQLESNQEIRQSEPAKSGAN